MPPPRVRPFENPESGASDLRLFLLAWVVGFVVVLILLC